MISEVAQSCLTLCDPMDCSLPGSFLHWVLQARVLEWVAISFSRGSSRPRDRTRVCHIGGRRFILWSPQGSPGGMLRRHSGVAPWPWLVGGFQAGLSVGSRPGTAPFIFRLARIHANGPAGSSKNPDLSQRRTHP